MPRMNSSGDAPCGDPRPTAPAGETAFADSAAGTPARAMLVGADAQKPSAARPQNEAIDTRKLHGNERDRHVKIIIVGESGLGKTTATNCLTRKLEVNRPPNSEDDAHNQSDPPKTIDIKEREKIQLRTTTDGSDNTQRERIWRIVDTPGYGDNLDITKDFDGIKGYIEEQYQKLADANSRAPIDHDSLVTCCLYFIAPHRLKDNDIAFMREVAKMVPVVPVIAKADTMTQDETDVFREQVRQRLKEKEVETYSWMLKDGRTDPKINEGGQTRPPFTIITAKSDEGRKYAWGTCKMEERTHSDFMLLKELVIAEHLFLMHENAYDRYDRHREEQDALQVRISVLQGPGPCN